MDDARTLLLSILFATSIFALNLSATDLEFIERANSDRLTELFQNSSFVESRDKKYLQKSWKCDMFGMRSRLQVQRNLELYKWVQNPKAIGWSNEGAQLVNEYKAGEGSLNGSQDRFEDQIKVTPDGNLISQLSVTKPEKMIVAYSICKPSQLR